MDIGHSLWRLSQTLAGLSCGLRQTVNVRLPSRHLTPLVCWYCWKSFRHPGDETEKAQSQTPSTRRRNYFQSARVWQRVVKGSHSFTCTPTRLSAERINHNCLCLSSRSWYSFTDPEGMEGWVGLSNQNGERTVGPGLLRNVYRSC